MGDASDYDSFEKLYTDGAEGVNDTRNWFDELWTEDREDGEDGGDLTYVDRALLGMLPPTPSREPGQVEEYVAAERPDGHEYIDQWVFGTAPSTPKRGLSHTARALLGMTPSTPGTYPLHAQGELSAISSSTSEAEK
jgi:hypothetical protein